MEKDLQQTILGFSNADLNRGSFACLQNEEAVAQFAHTASLPF